MDERFWGAIGAAVMAFMGGVGIWFRDRVRNGKVMTVRLDQEDRDILLSLQRDMQDHNKSSDDILKALTQVLLNQAEERGRHGGRG